MPEKLSSFYDSALIGQTAGSSSAAICYLVMNGRKPSLFKLLFLEPVQLNASFAEASNCSSKLSANFRRGSGTLASFPLHPEARRQDAGYYCRK